MCGDEVLPEQNTKQQLHSRAINHEDFSLGSLTVYCQKKDLAISWADESILNKIPSCLAKITTMSVAEQAKKDYENCAATYNDYSSLPFGQLESQLIKIALGDCAGLTVLDLGGGTGLRAREAVDLGAVTVDIVDMSPGMLKVGQEIETSLGRENVIRFFEADVSKSLSHLPLRENGYDLVMANWIFSYAGSVEILEGMFRNVVGYLKPGGLFVGARDTDPMDTPLESEKYGCWKKWVKNIPGGVKYLLVMNCTPPIEFEGVSLEIMQAESTKLHERFGLANVKVMPYESTEVVQKDPEFWKPFLERPSFAVIKAVKKME